MYRSIICVLIIASLILCSTSIAFANPLDPWTSVQADRVTNGVVSIDNTLSNVYTGLTALYNYLKNNGDGVVEGLLILANRVSNIISTIDYYLPNINTNLQNIYSSLAAHSGSNLDLWGLTNSILINTNALATGQLGIAQDVYNISNYVDGIEGKLDTLHSDNTSTNSKLDTLHSDLTTVNTKIQSLENINWTFSNAISYSLNGLDFYNTFTDLTSVNVNTRVFYVKINYSDYNYLGYLNLLALMDDYQYYDEPITVQFYTDSNENYPDYYLNTAYRNINLFIYPFSTFANRDVIIKFTTTNRFIIGPYSECYFKYINNNSVDFYTVDNFIQNHKKSDDTILSDIKNILIDIDNNSDFIQNNNDLQINVDIDPSVGQGVTGVISKIQDLLDFGIDIQEFLVVLNQFDNLHWFTSYDTYTKVNYDPRDNLGYQDLYD